LKTDYKAINDKIHEEESNPIGGGFCGLTNVELARYIFSDLDEQIDLMTKLEDLTGSQFSNEEIINIITNTLKQRRTY